MSFTLCTQSSPKSYTYSHRFVACCPPKYVFSFTFLASGADGSKSASCGMPASTRRFGPDSRNSNR